MKYIPSEQTGTISLENISKETSLTNPSWFIVAGHTSSLVPWDITPSEKGTISWRSPLAGTKFNEALTHTVHCLSYQIEGTNYHIVSATFFPFKIGKGKSGFTIFVMEKKHEAQTMKDILSIVCEGLTKVDINKLSSHLASNVQHKFIVESIPDRKITGLDSTKLERYYEWQYPIFTPQVRAKKGKEYYVKIVAAVGFGKALGMAVNVEVIPGSSPQVMSFQTQNPQVYQEPPRAISRPKTTTMAATSISKTEMPTNQNQPNLQAVNGNSLVASVKQTPAALPNDQSIKQNLTATNFRIKVIRRSGIRSKATKKLSSRKMRSFERFPQNIATWHTWKRRASAKERKPNKKILKGERKLKLRAAK